MADDRQRPGGFQERFCDVWIDKAQLSWAACEPEKQLEGGRDPSSHFIAALLRDTLTGRRVLLPHMNLSGSAYDTESPRRTSGSSY